MATGPASVLQKRKRFSAGDITPSKILRNDNGDSPDLVVSVRRWGSAFTVFDGASKDDPLWQLQVSHNGRNSFGFQVLAVAREAVLHHPNSKVRDLDQVESVLQVRLVNGAPPHTGPTDPDGVGLEPWQVVLYSTSTTSALDIVHFIMKYKVGKGHILHLPTMTASCQDGSLLSVPEPWALDRNPAQLPKPFAALPPRGRRHILCQLEVEQQTARKADLSESQQEEEHATAELEAGNTYIFSVFGGIYLYKDLFDAANIAGGYVAQADNSRDYVRFLQVLDNEDGRDRLTAVLEQVLMNVPVFFIDSTGMANDSLVQWLGECPSVHLGETTPQGA